MRRSTSLALCIFSSLYATTCLADCSYAHTHAVSFGDGSSQVTDLIVDESLSALPVVYETSNDPDLSVFVESNVINLQNVRIEMTGKQISVNFDLPSQSSVFSAAMTRGPVQLGQFLALAHLCGGRCRQLSAATYGLYLLSLNQFAVADEACPSARIKVKLPKYRCENGVNGKGGSGQGVIGSCPINPTALTQSEQAMQIDFVTADGSECSLKLDRMNPCFTDEAEIKIISALNSSAVPIPVGVATYANENCSITIRDSSHGRGIVHLGNDLVTIELKDGMIYLYQIYFNFSSCEEAPLPDEHQTSRMLQAPIRFDHCYSGDSYTWNIKLGIVVTQALLARFNMNQIEILAWLEEIVSNTNHVYGSQMNLNFIIDEVVFHENTDTSHPMEWNGCSSDPYTRLYSFATWVREQSFYNRKTLWHMFGDCFTGTGVIGIAYIQALCTGFGFNSGISNYDETITWISFAHEAGHNIGAQHGSTTGIMSRGTQYGGIFQFNPYESKNALCGNLQSVLHDPACIGVMQKVTETPTHSPTPSPFVGVCERHNNLNFGNTSEREAGCASAANCVWSALNGGECYEVNNCDDFNQFKEELNARFDACLQSTAFQCTYNNGLCSDNALPMSVIASTCEDNNMNSFAEKSVRKSGCTWDKGCAWSGKNGGECYRINVCEDINQFTRDDGARKTVCREDIWLPCHFFNGKCSTPTPTQSPVVSTCEQNNVKSFASKSVRESGCSKSKGCAWSPKNRGECYTVAHCNDYNQFKRDKGSRKAVCLDSDFDCAFSDGTCRKA